MITFDRATRTLTGPAGSLSLPPQDVLTPKLFMLGLGQCEGLGPTAAAQMFDYSRQYYHFLLKRFEQQGAEGLIPSKTGPKSNYRRTDLVVRQIIRFRFLDPEISPEVIAQKLRQDGYPISTTSVKRVIADFGLQKKTLLLAP